MHCTQEPGMLMELMDLGALPCFGLGLLSILLIKLTVYMMARDTEKKRDTELDAVAFLTGLVGMYLLALFIVICFFAGVMSILRDLATSQPIHWY